MLDWLVNFENLPTVQVSEQTPAESRARRSRTWLLQRLDVTAGVFYPPLIQCSPDTLHWLISLLLLPVEVESIRQVP